MTIEIHQPELEALIQERMASGRFSSVEDVLWQALLASPKHGVPEPLISAQKQNFADFLLESPLPGSGLVLERARDYPCPIDL